MSNTVAAIVAHLKQQIDPAERLMEELQRLPPEQRREVLVQFCPQCFRLRDPGQWDKMNCVLCS
jgi:hypothetical protein